MIFFVKLETRKSRTLLWSRDTGIVVIGLSCRFSATMIGDPCWGEEATTSTPMNYSTQNSKQPDILRDRDLEEDEGEGAIELRR